MDKEIDNKVEWISRLYSAGSLTIPIVRSDLTAADIRGGWMARWGLKRMKFKVEPGLYGIGNPREDSPVIVTANYKLTFDKVRSDLAGLDVFILVLDTKGINVWCAAGKGTFGTEELAKRILLSKLDKVINHKTLIVPQLGAVGVSAHEVKKRSGFTVKYGPVRSEDIKEYINSGYKKTAAMRKVTFTFKERVVLIPVEIMVLFKKALLPLFGAAILLAILEARGISVQTITGAAKNIAGVTGALISGSVLVPLLLPYIPLRSFGLKGALLGALWGAVFTLLTGFSLINLAVWLLLIIPISAFLGLNFTGSSTFTSLAGVKLEVKIATPLIIISLILGVSLKAIAAFGII